MTHLRRDSGQDLVEYAFVLPVLLLLLFGIVELSFAVLSYDTIANAAREGARAGVVNPYNGAAMLAAASELTTGLDPSRLNIIVPSGPTEDGQIEVEVIYDHQWITGPIIAALGGGGTVHLRTVASMQMEPLIW